MRQPSISWCGSQLHQQAVLVGAGLALVAVDHEVARPHRLRGEPPLDAGREAGAAAAEHGRALDVVVDLAPATWPARPANPRSRRWRGSARACSESSYSNREVTIRGRSPATKPGSVRIRGADHFCASAGAGIHTGAAVTSSGGTAPTARSDGMCWRTRATRAVRRDLAVEPTPAKFVDRGVEIAQG